MGRIRTSHVCIVRIQTIVRGGGTPYLIENKKMFLIVECVRTAIFYPMGAMWFVLACIVASLVIEKLFYHKNRNTFILLIGLCGYAYALLANTYYYIVENSLVGKFIQIYLKVCVSARNGFFVGIIFLWFGIVIANPKFYRAAIEQIFLIWGLFITSWITFFMEVYFAYGKNVADDSSLFISFLVMMPTGIILALRYNMSMNLPYKKMRKFSTCAYFSHHLFCDIAGFFMSGGVVKFGIVLGLSALFYALEEKCDNKYLHKIV